MLFTATPDSSSSSKNIKNKARVSRLCFRFLWLFMQVVERETDYIDLIRTEWIFRVSIHDMSKAIYNFRLMFKCSLKWKIGCQIFLWVYFFAIFQMGLEQYCQDKTNNFLGQYIVFGSIQSQKDWKNAGNIRKWSIPPVGVCVCVCRERGGPPGEGNH